MNCSFCHQPAIADAKHQPTIADAKLLCNIFTCQHNDIKVSFVIDPLMQICYTFFEQFKLLPYDYIYLTHQSNKTIFASRDPHDQIIYSLNYLIDITPDNAQEWLHKLSKLKAFL